MRAIVESSCVPYCHGNKSVSNHQKGNRFESIMQCCNYLLPAVEELTSPKNELTVFNGIGERAGLVARRVEIRLV